MNVHAFVPICRFTRPHDSSLSRKTVYHPFTIQFSIVKNGIHTMKHSFPELDMLMKVEPNLYPFFGFGGYIGSEIYDLRHCDP